MLGLFLAAGLASPAALAERQPAAAAIHVHSIFSNGAHDVESLARLAEERGVDVLVLTDSFLTRATYGVWPFDRIGIEGVNRMSRAGVRDHGIDAYLEAVRAAAEAHPGLIIVPGVEVAPAYYWTGKPWSGITLHDFDRHLWIVGLNADGLRHLPVIENETWSNTGLHPVRVAVPLLLLAAGVALIRIRGRSGPWRTGTLLIVLAMLLAWNNYPFGTLADPYSGERDPGAHQRLIDYVGQRGGVVYWSYPEARYGDVTARSATMVSRPHPEDLIETDRYHGFEGLYGDEIKATKPGEVWDQTLRDYRSGLRERPPFVVTGIDFHEFREDRDAWYTLDGGRTVLHLEERSVKGVLDALRYGRAYATFQGYPEKLGPLEFEVALPDGTAATHGESLLGVGPVTVRFSLSWEESEPEQIEPFRFELVRNGEVVESYTGALPVNLEYLHDLPPGRYEYRLQASAGRLVRVLGNPVFLALE